MEKNRLKVCEVCGATSKESYYIGYCSKANKVLCSRHRNQFNRLGYFLDNKVKKEEKVCEVCGATIRDSRRVCYCKKANKILCSKHLQQFYEHGTLIDYTAKDKNNIITQENYAEIELKNKFGEIVGYAIIDIDDVEICKKHKWYLNTDGYVRTSINSKHVSLHRYVLKYCGKREVDHINRNKLDNRKSNLRIVSSSENKVNMNRPDNNCIYKTRSGSYSVTIERNYKKVFQKDIRHWKKQ